MHRFFIPQADLLHQNTLTLTDKNEIHHLKNVLRLKQGSTVTVFNDQRVEAAAEIAELTPARVEIKILSAQKKFQDKPFTCVLACALPKKSKFEFILEKVTELGVDEIIPILTARTEVRLTPDKAKAKTERFRQVAINAAKQSKRVSVPVLHPVVSFKDSLKLVGKPTDLILIPWLAGNRRHLREFLPPAKEIKRVIFFIGPEGDFTPEEVALAQAVGAIPVSLGETVLKVDTAAISVVALMNFLTDPVQGNL